MSLNLDLVLVFIITTDIFSFEHYDDNRYVIVTWIDFSSYATSTLLTIQTNDRTNRLDAL